MSYSNLSHYGDYYDHQNQQSTSADNSRDRPRQTNSNNPYAQQASYPGDIRQSSYISSGYNWPNQSQTQVQSYSSGLSQGSGYVDSSWGHTSTQNVSQDQRSQSNSYTSSTTASTQPTFYGSSRPSTQGTSALSDLAYASGLDDTASQRYGQDTHRSKGSSGTSHTAHASGGVNHVQSPVKSHTPRFNQPSSSTTYLYQNDDAASSSQDKSLSAAAAALAGAVSARFVQASTAMGHQSSASPLMNTSVPRSAPVTSNSTDQHTQSWQNQTQRNKSSPQPQSNYRSGKTAYQTQPPARKSQPPEHNRKSSQPSTQDSSQSLVQPATSISNLVSQTVSGPPQTLYSIAGESQKMPNYIDPTQVFNPYAKEHERRRRAAAAQAEAGRQRAEVAAAQAEAAKRKIEEEKASKARKPKTTQNGRQRASLLKAQPVTDSLVPPEAPQAAPQAPLGSGDGDMAAELKMMMERMKEFRNKNPTLFQKLWEDMRKPTSQSAASALPPLPSVQRMPMQNSTTSPPPPAVPSPLLAQAPQPLSAPLCLPVGEQSQAHVPVPKSASASKPPRNLMAPDEIPPGAKLNGYKVVVENNPKGLPDLGRFPALCRVRNPYPKSQNEQTSVESQLTSSGPGQAQPSNETFGPQSPNHERNGEMPVLASFQQPVPIPAEQSMPLPPAPPVPAVPLTQGLPPRGPTGGTIWPEDKRNALAEAAVNALKQIPENANIDISPQDVHQMLEQNPSYIELCELLERKGLRFHRGYFARQLLSNVPYLNTPTNKQSPPVPSQVPPVQVPPPSAGQNDATATPVPAMAPDGRFAAMNGIVKYERTNPDAAQTARPRPARPGPLARPEPPPGSKEALARKRDFTELVDLTALSDNEDYVMSRKQARVHSSSPQPTNPFEALASSRYPERHAHTPGLQPSTAFLPPQPSNVAESPYLFDPNPLLRQPSNGPLPQYTAPAMPRSPVHVPQAVPVSMRPAILAKSINKEEALRKTYYDAKSVARDILIAAGRHPTERPLNAHLAGLLGKHIEIDSDLGTFNWDAVDPGGPAVPQVAPISVPMEPPRFAWGSVGLQHRRPGTTGGANGVAESESAKLPNAKAPAGIAPSPQVAIAISSVTSAVSGLVSALSSKPRQKVATDVSRNQSSPPVQVSTDIGPVRSRTVGIAAPPRQAVPPPKRALGRLPKIQPDISTQIPSQPADRPLAVRSASAQACPSVSVPAQTMKAPFIYPSGKRRGRPPGSKNVHPSFASLKNTAASLVKPSASDAAAPMKYTIFRCRWKACHAHLHNLDTLRNHISAVHTPIGEKLKEETGYICWWKKCSLLVAEDDGTVGPSEVFPTKEEWLAHIESHLREVALKLGDGPSLRHTGKPTKLTGASFPFDVSRFSFRNPTSQLPSPPPSSPTSTVTVARTSSHTDPQSIVQDRARYLADSRGRVTTPNVASVTLQADLPQDTMRLLPADHHTYEEQAQKAFIKTHRQEKTNPKAVAEETLKAVSAKKAKIGPGIDRGGCILVTEARRETLVQNPGIQRVVDGDY
jgi:hypothetical protein